MHSSVHTRFFGPPPNGKCPKKKKNTFLKWSIAMVSCTICLRRISSCWDFGRPRWIQWIHSWVVSIGGSYFGALKPMLPSCPKTQSLLQRQALPNDSTNIYQALSNTVAVRCSHVCLNHVSTHCQLSEVDLQNTFQCSSFEDGVSCTDVNASAPSATPKCLCIYPLENKHRPWKSPIFNGN